MNDIKIFNNNDFGDVRVIIQNDEPWFVGKDVASVLGYSEPRSAVSKKIDTEDKGVAKLETPSGKQEMTIINESGLYSLILSSKLPTAKKFKKWVTSEVLPSIRKQGLYATDELLNNPDLMIELLMNLKKEREEKKALQIQTARQQQIIGELKPKSDYTDIILQSKSLMTISQIAKDYGLSGKRLNKILFDLKVQYKQNGQWLLYSNHQAKGYTKSETTAFVRNNGQFDSKLHTKWTQKGRLFLYDLLKNNSILPIINNSEEE